MPAAKCASALTRCSIASLLNSSELSAASLCARRPPVLPVSFFACGPVAQPDNTATRRTSATAHLWLFEFIAEPGPQKRSPAGAGLTRIHCYHCFVVRATYCCQVRFLWRCSRSFLRRLCLLIFAFRRFFNEPIIIFCFRLVLRWRIRMAQANGSASAFVTLRDDSMPVKKGSARLRGDEKLRPASA